MQLTDDETVEHTPSWSPDGSRSVFSKGGDHDQSVFVMRADGSDVHQLADESGALLYPTSWTG